MLPGLPDTTGHLPEPRYDRVPGLRLTGVVVFFVVALFIGLLLYYAQFSGTIRWLLGVAFLTVVAGLAWNQIVRRTVEPVPLVGVRQAGASREGELGAFAAAVRRATRGLPYSQVLVASRARSAFLEHARLSKGLAPEAMREIQRDPVGLRNLFADDVLADFLLLPSYDLEDRYGWVREARSRGGFTKEFRGILDRMEAWR